jgi:tetratricopeptide (TPR) repeat protein
MLLGGWFWYMQRQAVKRQTLLTAATSAEQAHDWAGAESALRRYAQLAGDDPEMCRRIGKAIENGASNDEDRRRAIPFYAKAVSRAPENKEARLRFGDLQVDVNPVESVRQADVVLKSDPSNAEALSVKALALIRMAGASDPSGKNQRDAYAAVRVAIGGQPGSLRLVSRSAEFLYRNAKQLSTLLRRPAAEFQSEALTALDQLVKRSNDEAESRLARVRFRLENQLAKSDDPQVREDLERLVTLRPTSSVIRLLAAGWYASRAFAGPPQSRGETVQDPKSLERAKADLVEASKNRSDDPIPYWSLAQLEWWSGQREAAVEALQKGRQSVGDDNPILALRLAETQIAIGLWPEAEKSLRQLSDIIDGKSPENEAQGAKPQDSSQNEKNQNAKADDGTAATNLSSLRPMVDLLWAQWWLGVGNPASDPQKALALLEKHVGSGTQPGFRALAFYLRGLAYASLEGWDEALEAFSSADRVSEVTILPRLAQAYCMYRLGRYRDASARYQSVLTSLLRQKITSINVTQVWIEAARCALAEQSRLPVSQRDWKKFNEALEHLREVLPDSPIPMFMEFESRRLRQPNQSVVSEDELREADKKYGNSPEYWQLLAIDRLRGGDLAAAQTAIETWEKKTGGSAKAFRAELAEQRGDVMSADKFWEEASAGASERQQRAYLTRRVQLALAGGFAEHARECVEAWLKTHPDDADAQYQACQIAWTEGNAVALEKAAASLRRIEGNAGRRWNMARTQALLLAAVEKPSPEKTKQLQQSCAELVERLPQDRQVRVLEAIVAETTGNLKQAVTAWRKAISLGTQDTNALLRCAGLLHSQGQSRDAIQLCLMLPATASDCRGACLAARILTTAVVDAVDCEQAETLFKTLLDGPAGPAIPLLLSNLSVLREYQGRPDDAIALTRKALEVQPKAVELRNNLAWFLAAYKNGHAEAEKLINEAIKDVGPEPMLLDTRGVILIIAGRPAEAIEPLETAVKESVTPVRLLHLAEAYRSAGRAEDSRRVFAQAESQGLKDLGPWDQQVYLKLKAQ